MNPVSLPPEFDEISGMVTNVRRKSANEYSSSCPWCGGDDRFVLWRVSKYGKPLGWCRANGHVWVPDQGKKPTKEEIELWRQEQIKVETARKEAAERALALLNSEQVWEKFYAQNNEFSLQTFRGWGVLESMVKYQQWGLHKEYQVKSLVNNKWEHYYAPAATLPVWGTGSVVQNVQLRVLNPRRDNDRYRNYYEAGRSYLFVAYHDLPLENAVVLVEGLKKAVVMAQALDNPSYSVVGIQSKRPDPEVLEGLKDCGVIYLCPDPDAFLKAEKKDESAVQYLVRLLGKDRCRIVEFPAKPDDSILQGADPRKFIRMAKRA